MMGHSGPSGTFWAFWAILAPGPHISFWATCASLVNLGCSSYCVRGFGKAAAAAEIMEQPMCTWRDMI